MSFSCNHQENVTIILGNNTFGKTTLLQAFSWCLYNEVTFETDPDFLLNHEIAASLSSGKSATVEVEICLIHSDTEYLVTRSQIYSCTNGRTKGLPPEIRVSYKEPDGQTESVRSNQIDNVINSILPKDLSTYFFFDTERVGSISTRKDVADAVKGLLGLAIIENALKHLGTKSAKTSVIGGFYASMDADGDQRAKEALVKIQHAEDARDEIAKQLGECTTQITHYEKRKVQLDDILRDNRDTAVLQNKKEDREERIHAEEIAINTASKAYTNGFSKGALFFFAQPLLNKVGPFLEKVNIDDKGVKDLTRATILDLINRQRCLCGQEICDGNPAHQNLVEQLSFVPPESIGNTVHHYRSKLSIFLEKANMPYDSLNILYKEILRAQSRIYECQEELADINSQIDGKENMAHYNEELHDVKKRLRDFNRKKEQLISNDGGHIKDIDTYKKIYESLVAVSSKNKEIMQLLSYAEEIRDWLGETYSEQESEMREALETKVNEIFKTMYHGHRRVSIDQRYQVSLLTTVADKEIITGESEGANRVKNFAFIAGLVSLAKDRLTAAMDEQALNLSSEPYPLVMDAPFSNADETHIENISRVLPEIAEQVIMFVMEKDWRYAQKVMGHKVGKQYNLIKHSETYTELR